VGRFSASKGVPDLVRSLPKIAAEHPGVRLALVGYGPEEETIRKTIDEQGVADRVTMPGRIPGDEIPSYMASADLLVLPSIRIEGLGVVLLEALASGTAVVGSDVGGIPDIIEDGVTGLLCRSGDPESIAARCIRLLGDEELRRRTTENGRRLVEARFGWPRIGEALETVLAESVRNPRVAPRRRGEGRG
jgi:glycosyltransferase involved in cell wall biosynthesis